MPGSDITPIRRQYLRVKEQYPQALVLFRLGDFYETFDEDARTVARELEIVLTSREMGKGNRVPMAGIPYHALDNYLARLVNHGHKVAICEQMSPPSAGRDLVEREVTRVVTPGTVTEPSMLDSRKNNYLVSVVCSGTEAGIAHVDITTSEFGVTQLPLDQATVELARLAPSEIVLPESEQVEFGIPEGAEVTRLEDFAFGAEAAERSLLQHFGVASLEGYGCAGLPLAVRAAGGIVEYISRTQKAALPQITHLSTYHPGSFMVLDEQTMQNLEVLRNGRTGAVEGSLLGVLDFTRTPMGGRLLRRWLSRPLLDSSELVKRQDGVDWFCHNHMAKSETAALLSRVADLERLINRIAGGVALPRETVSLRRSLEIIPQLRASMETAGAPAWLWEGMAAFPDIIALLQQSINDEPSSSPGDGNVIRRGFSEELDSLFSASRDASQFIASLERKEQEKTGIKSLRVGYNKVFGYYIEVSKPNLAQVPAEYIRKQTLVNGERFITPELKEYESLILNARERIEELETSLYRQVCRQVAGEAERVLATARELAIVDVIAALAEAAIKHGYVRPEIVEGTAIKIRDGRHPVVETTLPGGSFVPNDTELDTDDSQIVILTGPNMAGKSTYLKQVALIVLMAQIGSFVPAASAKIGLVDRIFTRIGAREDLVSGQSTFMAEMVETANILNNATPRSLLILDEIGRGTSTYDGMSIAKAVVEYIHNDPRASARTLFATHYHELIELAAYLPRVRNFNVAVSEEKGKVIFLRKIVPGGADRSYGIHVAQLAGLPKAVVHRAQEVLSELEASGLKKPARRSSRLSPPQLQISLFGEKHPVLEALEKLEINSLTPLEALTKLYELQRKARE